MLGRCCNFGTYALENALYNENIDKDNWKQLSVTALQTGPTPTTYQQHRVVSFALIIIRWMVITLRDTAWNGVRFCFNYIRQKPRKDCCVREGADDGQDLEHGMRLIAGISVPFPTVSIIRLHTTRLKIFSLEWSAWADYRLRPFPSPVDVARGISTPIQRRKSLVSWRVSPSKPPKSSSLCPQLLRAAPSFFWPLTILRRGSLPL